MILQWVETWSSFSECLTVCCPVSKEEQGSGFVGDWGRQKHPLEPELYKVSWVLVPCQLLLPVSLQYTPGNWHFALGSLVENIPTHRWGCLCRAVSLLARHTSWVTCQQHKGRTGRTPVNKSRSAYWVGPFHMSQQWLQWWGRKQGFDSEARITKGCKYCIRSQNSHLRPWKVFLIPFLEYSASVPQPITL